MSYPVFLILGLSLASAIAIAIAGPLSVLPVIGFWVAHYFFLSWLYKSASLTRMSDSELADVLGWWIGAGPFGRNKPDLIRVRERDNSDELIIALKRIIDIFDEQIERKKIISLDTSNDKKNRQQYASELEELTNNSG